MQAQLQINCLNAFCNAAQEVISETLGDSPSLGEIQEDRSAFAISEVSIGVGLVGDLEGHINFGMTTDTAKAIAARMLEEDQIPELDDMACSAICELANMICGAARGILAQSGVNTAIAPPSLLVGASGRCTWPEIVARSISLKLGPGAIQLTLGVR